MAGTGGLLGDGDMDKLESWIGTGPKQFILLYKITRDGCDGPTFHQKCDNQGPTVTVLYNTHGTVCGGYASQSWTSNSQWIKDPHAFVFQLKYNNSPSNRKFLIKSDRVDYSLFLHSSYGPTFGGGHDLPTFTSSITNSGGTFALNGSMTTNNTYDCQGLTADQIFNDTKAVSELEVYKVTDGKRTKAAVAKQGPWRETPTWNEQYLSELQELVVNYKPISSPRVPQARILLVGPVGAGKSSFYNTINSVFQERITHKAISGSSDSSLTNVYTQYQVRTRSDAKLNFRLCDTRGLEESKGTDNTEFGYLLDGHIPDYYEFDPEGTIKADSLLRQPGLADKIHCVAFVLDATTLDVMSSGITQKIKNFQKQIHKRGIPQVVLFTKVDNLCESVKEDAGNMFRSEVVERAVKKAAEIFRIPRGNVLPVKNYEDEVALKNNVSISAMLALQQMLHFANDFLDYQRDRAAVQERGIGSDLLLTKTDKLCQSVKRDMGNMFKSESVESVLNKAADAFGIPPGNVLPVKNYATEVALNNSVSISAMLALQQMLNFADDFLDYQRDRAAVEERGVQRLDMKE